MIAGPQQPALRCFVPARAPRSVPTGIEASVRSVSAAGSTPSRWASARAKSMQLLNRSLGSFDSALPSTGSSADNSGRRSAMAGGDAVRCWLMTTVGLEW